MAKKPTPKVSPSRGMSVDAWVKAKAGPHGGLVKKLLAIAKRAAPGSTVSIKWNQPVVDDHGPVAYVMPAKAHVTFGFWRGAELSDPDGLLEGGDRMKHLKLAAGEKIDEKLLAGWVREAVKLNEQKGDPSRR